MTKDTVILDVVEYNKLRDFKNEIEKGNILKKYSNYSGYTFICGLDVDEAIILLANENDELKERIINKDKIIQKLKYKCSDIEKPTESKEKTIEEIRNMSYFEFRRWSKKKK